ncbi:MAG: DUF5134 domain-containing protein [Streptosporangiaceae bacterium]|nr:DUF5134 domain-containing protein [Streptosporangiaceae bacterium]
MSGPAWLAAIFAALMLVVAAGCACRLAVSWLHGKDTERDADGLHVGMGVAMAGMLEPRLIPVPGFAWAAVFAAGAAWFSWRAIRAGGGAGRAGCAHPVAHAVECAAMVYMLLPVGSWPSGRGSGMAMPGMSRDATAGNPALTVVLALFMLGYAVWAIDRLASSSGAVPAAAGAGRSSVAAVTTPAAARAEVAGTTGHPRSALAPRLGVCCTIAMAVTMGYMLVVMLFS